MYNNTIHALSDISYDISVDIGAYDEETTVTIRMPYNNLKYLFVMDKEEKKAQLLNEYTVDWRNPFDEKTVYIKTPMRFEYLGEEEKAMLLTTNYIRDHTTLTIHRDDYVMKCRIEAAFQVSTTEPVLKASAVIRMINSGVDSERIQDAKEKLTDILIHKVQTYYKVQEYKEEKKMAALTPETIRIAFGCTTKHVWTSGLPAVKKVETYNNRVVKVTFIDGTYTKAVCSENDNFDLDMGITICAMKRLLGTNSENATREYNRFIDHVHSVMEKNALEEVAEEARKAKEKSKKRKAELKRAAKKLKAREEQIDIQKQAILRAQKETFSQFEGGAPI